MTARLNNLTLSRLSKTLLRSLSTSTIHKSNGLSYLHRIEDDPLKFLTFGKCLKIAAEKYPDRNAVVSCAENSSITFAEVLDKVQNLMLTCKFTTERQFLLHNRVIS